MWCGFHSPLRSDCPPISHLYFKSSQPAPVNPLKLYVIFMNTLHSVKIWCSLQSVQPEKGNLKGVKLRNFRNHHYNSPLWPFKARLSDAKVYQWSTLGEYYHSIIPSDMNKNITLLWKYTKIAFNFLTEYWTTLSLWAIKVPRYICHVNCYQARYHQRWTYLSSLGLFQLFLLVLFSLSLVALGSHLDKWFLILILLLNIFFLPSHVCVFWLPSII